jgi:hypothetical protein
MNANELAKGLSQNQIYGDDYGLFNKRIQNMLRQQQAEIEALKAENKFFKDLMGDVEILRKVQENG